MLDALRHQFGQKVQASYVVTAQRLCVENHAPAPQRTPDAQCQKPLMIKKNLYLATSFPTAPAQNAQILSKRQQTALTKNNELQPQKTVFSIDPQTQKPSTAQTRRV